MKGFCFARGEQTRLRTTTLPSSRPDVPSSSVNNLAQCKQPPKRRLAGRNTAVATAELLTRSTVPAAGPSERGRVRGIPGEYARSFPQNKAKLLAFTRCFSYYCRCALEQGGEPQLHRGRQMSACGVCCGKSAAFAHLLFK